MSAVQLLDSLIETFADEPDVRDITPDSNIDVEVLKNVCTVLRSVKQNGGGLHIATGAGMSVQSGVPVFRSSNGAMSPDFLAFLSEYNTARAAANLPTADDWFDFSVPEMFRKETSVAAWHYWRWRTLRARVTPSRDYQLLRRLIEWMGEQRVFVVTSNCDGLHIDAGTSKERILEIHGSLSRLQCSHPCCAEFYAADEAFRQRLASEPDWVPRCPRCEGACLRPNVMIFGDDALVGTEIIAQERRFAEWEKRHGSNFVTLEIGAGTVVPSIRAQGEQSGFEGRGLIRVNPSRSECEETEMSEGKQLQREGRYWPMVATSDEALTAICDALGLLSSK